jgi:hypothetical protein
LNINEFEDLVVKKKMRLERRFAHNGYDVFVADGYSSPDFDDKHPHYKTMYAYSEGTEKMIMGEFFATPVVFPILTKEERLEAAEKRAKEYMDFLKDAKCQTKKQ